MEQAVRVLSARAARRRATDSMHASPVSTIDLSPVLLQSNGDGVVTMDLLAVLSIAALALVAVVRLGWWRLPARETGRRPADPLIWLLAASVVYLSGSLGVAAGGVSDDPAYARLSVAVLGNLLQCALATAFVLHLSRPAAAPAHPLPRALLAGVLGFAVLTPLTMATSIVVNELLVLAGMPRAPKASHETLAILVERRDPLLTTLTLAHVAVLVPIAEELLWRGIIQPAFRAAANARVAVAATAALFVLIHWSAIAPEGRAAGLSMIAVLAIGLGILRERTGSVVAPIVVHALFNAANVAIALAEKPVSSSP
jgi:membrane protease YdiL (CAAX protease family)